MIIIKIGKKEKQVESNMSGQNSSLCSWKSTDPKLINQKE